MSFADMQLGTVGNISTNFPPQDVDRDFNSYFSLFFTLLYLFPLAVVNAVLAVAVAQERGVTGTIRFFLVNLLSASELVIVGISMWFTSTIVIQLSWVHNEVGLPVSDFGCRLMLWLIGCGGAARLVFMAAYAVTIYALVRYGAQKMQLKYAVIAGVALWILVMVPNTAIFSPAVVLINFHDNDSCAAHGTGAPAYVYAFGYIGLYGVSAFTITVVMPFVTYHYIKTKTITGDDSLMRAMVRFALFLACANIINFVGQTTPLLFAAFAPAGMDWYNLEKAFNYVEGVFILLSLIPTPILILVFFRPIRLRVKRMLCSVCLKKTYQVRSSSKVEPETACTASVHISSAKTDHTN